MEGSGPDAKAVDETRERVPTRPLLSLVVAGIVLVIVCGNFSDAGIQGTLKRTTQPIRTITGLNQHWDAFAPDPRTDSTYVDGRVDYVDGSSTTYRITTRRGLGAYVDYRWQKFEESFWTREDHWFRYAMYLAERSVAEGRDPLRVTLIRRSSETLPPGPGPERGPWVETPMFVLDLDG